MYVLTHVFIISHGGFNFEVQHLRVGSAVMSYEVGWATSDEQLGFCLASDARPPDERRLHV